MKKLKEFLFLLVPTIVFAIAPVIIFITSQNKNAFIGSEHYLRLLLNDDLFKTLIFNTYFYPFIFSLSIVLIFALLCHFIKYIKSRKIFFSVSVVLASVIAFFSIYLNKANYFGTPMGVYDPQYLISNSPPSISISIYDVLLALLIGFLITFIFWLLELLVLFIKKKKSTFN